MSVHDSEAWQMHNESAFPDGGDLPHGVNRHGDALAPLPSVDEVLAAMPEGKWQRAQQIAMSLGVEGSRRLGTKASKGNWSGGMKAGVRLTHRLSAMYRRGLVDRRYDWEFGDTYEFRRRSAR